MNVTGITRTAYPQNMPNRAKSAAKTAFEEALADQQKSVAKTTAQSDKSAEHQTTIGDIRALNREYGGLMTTRSALEQLSIPKQLEQMDEQKAFLQKLVDQGLLLEEDIESSFMVIEDGSIYDLKLIHSSDLLTDLENVREYEIKLNERQISKGITQTALADHIASLDRLISALTPIARPPQNT